MLSPCHLIVLFVERIHTQVDITCRMCFMLMMHVNKYKDLSKFILLSKVDGQLQKEISREKGDIPLVHRGRVPTQLHATTGLPPNGSGGSSIRAGILHFILVEFAHRALFWLIFLFL